MLDRNTLYYANKSKVYCLLLIRDSYFPSTTFLNVITTHCSTQVLFPNICKTLYSCCAVGLKEHISGGGDLDENQPCGCVFPVVYMRVQMVYIETCICVDTSPAIRYLWREEGRGGSD